MLIGVLFQQTTYLASQICHQNAAVLTVGLQSSSGQTSNKTAVQRLKRRHFDDEFVMPNSWLVEREPDQH